MKFPDRNQPLEAEPNIRKIQEELVKVMDEVKVLRAWRDQVSSKQSDAAGDATDTNVQVRQNTRDIIELWDRAGLPPGGAVSEVVRKRSANPGDAFWSTEVIGQMATYFIDLEQGAALWNTYAGDANEADIEDVIPVPEITDDGTRLRPIVNASNDFFPANIVITVNPHTDLEEFALELPTDNSFGNGAPFWTLQIENRSSVNQARVNIENLQLFYPGTTIPVNGDESVWDLPPNYSAAWFVQAVFYSSAAVATPMTKSETTYGGRELFDPYYAQHVAVPTGSDLVELIRDTVASVLVAGSGISITVNDTGNTILITNTGGGGPTTGYGAGAYGGLPDYGG